MSFTLITGPMFSGKTEELLRIKTRYDISKKKTLLFKPKIDTRSECAVVTHNSRAAKALEITYIDDIFPVLENHKKQPSAVFIDEFQFIKNVTIKKIRNITENRGIDLYVCGLVLDSFREPFGTMLEILPYADIKQLTSVCSFCGSFSAKYTYREDGNPSDKILVGGKNIYKAICTDCLLKKGNL